MKASGWRFDGMNLNRPHSTSGVIKWGRQLNRKGCAKTESSLASQASFAGLQSDEFVTFEHARLMPLPPQKQSTAPVKINLESDGKLEKTYVESARRAFEVYSCNSAFSALHGFEYVGRVRYPEHISPQ